MRRRLFLAANSSSRGFAGVGIDLSAQAVSLCRQRVGPLGIEVHCLPIEQLQAEPFDVVICGEVLEHIEQDGPFLREIRKRLRTGGALVLSVPLDMRLWNEADEAAGHYRRYSKVEILDKLQSAGFAIERAHRLGLAAHQAASLLDQATTDPPHRPTTRGHTSARSIVATEAVFAFGALLIFDR